MNIKAIQAEYRKEIEDNKLEGSETMSIELHNQLVAQAITQTAEVVRKEEREKLEKNFVIFVRPEANIIHWLAQTGDGNYHQLQEVRASEALESKANSLSKSDL